MVQRKKNFNSSFKFLRKHKLRFRRLIGMGGKVRFNEKTTVKFIMDTKDEDYWRRTKQKTIAYIKYKSKKDFHDLMKDDLYRAHHYERIDRINRHRLKTLDRFSHTKKINNNGLLY